MTDLLGIPIIKTEVVGFGPERPFCQLIDHAIVCNAAGLELLKKEIERRNKEGT